MTLKIILGLQILFGIVGLSMQRTSSAVLTTHLRAEHQVTLIATLISWMAVLVSVDFETLSRFSRKECDNDRSISDV